MNGPTLSPETFQVVRELIFAVAGISMTREKEELVRSRLMARLRELKIADYETYLKRIKSDPSELSNMVDVLTTNETSFFREQPHFDFMREQLFPRWRSLSRPLSIWSAGCSSGEEPYSLAMFLCEHLPEIEARILATDLSLRVLTKAKRASYASDALESIPVALRNKYLARERGGAAGSYRIAPRVAERVSFARLNLMGDWPMRGLFDLILCRNVMIYFNDQTRTTLVCRLAELLAPGAHLFIGHAESLSALSQPLRPIKPAIYAV